MNPYWGKDFFGFIALFFQRLFTTHELASDEVQIYTLSLIAISSAFVGSFLVLRKMVMLANSLSHTILLGIVIAYLLSHQLLDLKSLILAALISALFTAFLAQFLTHVMRLQEDASIGLSFTALFALGVVLVSVFTRSTHLGIEAIMGNVDALHVNDLKLAGFVALSTTILTLLFYKELKITSFDAGLARALGISPTWIGYLLMVLTSFTAIAAFRAVGVLLFLALLIAPVLIARLLTARLWVLILLSVSIGILSSFIAVGLARHLLSVQGVPVSTSGLLVLLLGLFFAVGVMFNSWKLRPVKG